MRGAARLPIALIAIVFVTAGLTSCGSDGSAGSTPTAATRPRSTAELRILSPDPGAVLEGTEVAVRLDLTGGRITEEVSTSLKPDEGHIHLKLDGRTITLLGTLEETIDGLTPGTHLLEAEFVAADHGPFSPRVLASVTFSVA